MHKPGDVVLVDEADYFAFSYPVEFSKMIARIPAVCFMGKSPDADLNVLEHQVLKKMGLVNHTYWPQSIETSPKPEAPKKISVESDQDLVQKLDLLAKDMPILIFTSDATAEVIVNTIASAVMVT